VKGEEYAEHDTEETQYRWRMRIESGIQVLRHVPTIRRGLLSPGLIGHAGRRCLAPATKFNAAALAYVAELCSADRQQRRLTHSHRFAHRSRCRAPCYLTSTAIVFL
jgi:hypothetical protein